MRSLVGSGGLQRWLLADVVILLIALGLPCQAVRSATPDSEVDLTVALVRPVPGNGEPLKLDVTLLEHPKSSGVWPSGSTQPVQRAAVYLFENGQNSCAPSNCLSSSNWDIHCVLNTCGPQAQTESDHSGRAGFEIDDGEYLIVVETPAGVVLGLPLATASPPPGGVWTLQTPPRSLDLKQEKGVPGCSAEGLATPQTAAASVLPEETEVRVLYFVPSDMTANSEQHDRIAQASQDVHRWYADHTDSGRTLRWTHAVEDVVGLNNTAYYSVDVWPRVLNELSSRGFPLWEPGKVFVVWAKGVGLWAGGLQSVDYSGAAILGADLFIEDGCSPTHPSNWPCTPAGAMAHELGHTFGLPHPDTVGNWYGADLNSHSLMGSHWSFPERYPRSYTPPSPWGLLTYERDVLRYSPVVSETNSPYPAIPGDLWEKPQLPTPWLELDGRLVTVVELGSNDETTWHWNDVDVLDYHLYWSTEPAFASRVSVATSPTSGQTLSHVDSGEEMLYFKVSEIPIP